MSMMVTTNVAKHLAPFVALASPSVHATPSPTNSAVPNQASNWTPPPSNYLAPRDVMPSSVDSEPSEPRRLGSESPSDTTLNTSENNDGLSVSTVEVKTTQFTYSKELLTLSELTPIYIKS